MPQPYRQAGLAKGARMSRTGNPAALFASLLVFWILLNGTMSVDVLLAGIAAALAITAIFRGDLAFFAELRTSPQALLTALRFIPYFLKELVKANLRLAAIVLSPALPLRPGIVKVRTRLKSPIGRLLLANSITLTPGTLSVEMDGEWLYIHWVTVESADIDAATAEIVGGFERYLEVMYG